MRHLITAIFLLFPGTAFADVKIAGTSSYVINQPMWSTYAGTFWMQDNKGTYTVSEGPIEPGAVQCVGSGYGDSGGVRGDGICIFGEGEDTFIWAWATAGTNKSTWRVVGGTGRYAGMRGQGTATSGIDSKYRAVAHRVTQWQGMITLPK